MTAPVLVPTQPGIAATAETPACEFINVGKQFGAVKVLRDVSLEVKRAEKLALIGPSGSGKSTLLRTLMTQTIDAGEIKVNGETLSHGSWPSEQQRSDGQAARARRRRIGMVFQQFNLFPHMTAAENVAVSPRKVLGLPRKEAAERAQKYLAMVGMDAKSNELPSRLSGGQQQRVAIARSLAMEPEVMLFDEVTSALDPELVGEVLGVLRKLGEESNLTMLLVTHQMEFARSFAHRVAFLWQGQIHEVAEAKSIFDNPSQDRTRQFLHAVLEAR
ncbi:MAG: amino acid ABC transporter ATP-binding protein [Mesorhizobium sp.]|uniref:amino acid ABC transporter ATP-binding protein n=1 Tax=Mesorhizobium sp. TaxID=1871066 RepID=UPI000FE93294|nr:amino acid ABC transporter ATP-binding protein [Mesorhizobium sp.]RWM47996.1 MAG: amino acid ABC transporter ATP-binding protein [Mesorhizobium sp.]RWM89353.1 MAG: amino acid ABC transporter ATP-binding protein [Mesorhizobium sp.]TIN43250.1 MAG: amino acid ABC transporter ATP-binding protein [Mesorhizobium sp.]